jgi:hypothetical protein
LAAFVAHEVGDDFLLRHDRAHAAGQKLEHPLFVNVEGDLRRWRWSDKSGNSRSRTFMRWI